MTEVTVNPFNYLKTNAFYEFSKSLMSDLNKDSKVSKILNTGANLVEKKAISKLLMTNTLFTLETAQNITIGTVSFFSKYMDLFLLNEAFNRYKDKNDPKYICQDIFAIIVMRGRAYYSISKDKESSLSNIFRLEAYKLDIKNIIKGIKSRSFSTFVDGRTEDALMEYLVARSLVCRKISITILVYFFHLYSNYNLSYDNINYFIKWLVERGYKWINLPDKLTYDVRSEFMDFIIPNEVEVIGGKTIKYLYSNIEDYKSYYSQLYPGVSSIFNYAYNLKEKS